MFTIYEKRDNLLSHSNLIKGYLMNNNITVNCSFCNNSFKTYRWKYNNRTSLYCSKDCFNEKRRSVTVEDIFFKRTIKTDGCWLYDSAKNTYGYAQIKKSGKFISAHVLSYKIYKGEIPEGMFVCHSCDNPGCVKPDHLFLGTPKQNAEDMVFKGRQQKGSKRWNHKLVEEQVLKIKCMLKDGINYREIAKHFSVSEHVIHKIKQNKNWVHVKYD